MNIMANLANPKQRPDDGSVPFWAPDNAAKRPATAEPTAEPTERSPSARDDPMAALNPSALHCWARSASLNSHLTNEAPAQAEEAPGGDGELTPGIGSEQDAQDAGEMAMSAIGAAPSKPIRVLLADDHVMVRVGICSLLEGLDGVEVVGQASNGHEALRLLEARMQEAAPSGAGTDIAILDISMSGMNGLETAAHIARCHPETRVIMLSMHDSEEYVKQALRARASGYLLKESGFNELEGALRAVARGEIYLSPGVSRHLAAAYISHSGSDSFNSSTSHSGSHAGRGEEAGKKMGRRSSDAVPGGEAVVLTPRQQEILRLLAQGLSNGQIASRLSISIKTVETHRAGLMNRLNIFDIVGLVRYAVRHGYIEPL